MPLITRSAEAKEKSKERVLARRREKEEKRKIKEKENRLLTSRQLTDMHMELEKLYRKGYDNHPFREGENIDMLDIEKAAKVPNFYPDLLTDEEYVRYHEIIYTLHVYKFPISFPFSSKVCQFLLRMTYILRRRKEFQKEFWGETIEENLDHFREMEKIQTELRKMSKWSETIETLGPEALIVAKEKEKAEKRNIRKKEKERDKYIRENRERNGGLFKPQGKIEIDGKIVGYENPEFRPSFVRPLKTFEKTSDIPEQKESTESFEQRIQTMLKRFSDKKKAKLLETERFESD